MCGSSPAVGSAGLTGVCVCSSPAVGAIGVAVCELFLWLMLVCMVSVCLLTEVHVLFNGSPRIFRIVFPLVRCHLTVHVPRRGCHRYMSLTIS